LNCSEELKIHIIAPTTFSAGRSFPENLRPSGMFCTSLQAKLVLRNWHFI
jgi:hypothetical protein